MTVTLADSVGMAIKVTQPYVWSSGTYRNYFDLTVSYTQLPGLPLRGVLGPTFPVRTAFKMGKRDSWTGEP